MDILLNYELQELLENYGRVKKADDEFILQAFNIILKHKNISKIVDNVCIGKDAYLFNEAYYQRLEKTIYMKSNINTDDVIEEFFSLTGDKIYIYNLKVIKEILVLCNTLSENEYVNGFVRNLLYLSSQYNIEGLKPNERMALISANKEISNLAHQAYLANKDIANNYFKYQTILSLLNGYYIKNNEVISPTLDFYLKCNQQILANASCYGKTYEDINRHLLSEANKNSLDNKLYLGLPITTDEYQSVNNLLDETHSKLLRTKNLFF